MIADEPVQARVENGRLVITIGINTLARTQAPARVPTDRELFAADLAEYLTRDVPEWVERSLCGIAGTGVCSGIVRLQKPGPR